jgi:D-alanyl-D-alanine dipeptidase
MHTEIHTAAALGRRDQNQPPCRPAALDRPCYHQGKMKPILLLCALLLLAVGASAQRPSDRALIAKADKLIIVTTPEWNSVKGRLVRYEKRGGHWEQLGGPVEIVVGKDAPVKREGDGRSPAGVFRLTQTFGFADSLPVAKEYLPLTPAIECVDDVKSKHYAHIVDGSEVPVDWNSSEKMREISLYKWGVVVPYNMSDTKSGAGSCIFLHIRPASGNGTAGCTAMPEANIEEIVRWIGKGAVLVQMPEVEYANMKTKLSTP